MLKLSNSIQITSKTIPNEQIAQILETKGILFKPGHYQYPTNDGERIGNHLDAIFLIEPICKNDQFINWIVADICKWIKAEDIRFNTIFAPAQPAVQKLVSKLAQETNAKVAYWQYLTTGWFGDKLIEGEIKPGDTVLVVNGVTQQGRCVGERLPAFVESLGGKVTAAAVFAKGNAPGVKKTEEHYGNKFYSTIQVEISIFTPNDCPMCQLKESPELIPWTKLRDNQ